jgi:transcriptional repressor NrdR
MKCPYCDNSDTKVIDSREVEEGRAIRRRRECEKCTERFSTREKIELLNLVVVKKNKEKEEYNKNKITNSLSIATNKRLKESELEDLIAGVEAQIFARGKNKIETKEIGNIILEKLKNLDEVAYLRYVSVFKSFGSGNRFTKELNKF